MSMGEPGEPFTRVTLGVIYDKLVQLDKKVDPIPTQVSDHEVRIRAIERYLWIWIGAAGVVGAGAGQLVARLIGAP
jgi:hypothetical protein